MRRGSGSSTTHRRSRRRSRRSGRRSLALSGPVPWSSPSPCRSPRNVSPPPFPWSSTTRFLPRRPRASPALASAPNCPTVRRSRAVGRRSASARVGHRHDVELFTARAAPTTAPPMSHHDTGRIRPTAGDPEHLQPRARRFERDRVAHHVGRPDDRHAVPTVAQGPKRHRGVRGPTQWFSVVDNACYNGFSFPVTFSFAIIAGRSRPNWCGRSSSTRRRAPYCRVAPPANVRPTT